MGKIKKYTWLVLRFCILGPLAVVAVLGCWAEEAFEYLDPKLGPNDSEA